MPRMNLTDTEAALVLRQRQLEDAHREGWNKAIAQIEANVNDLAGDGLLVTIGAEWLNTLLERMKK
jgi:hypothetical protein